MILQELKPIKKGTKACLSNKEVANHFYNKEKDKITFAGEVYQWVHVSDMPFPNNYPNPNDIYYFDNWRTLQVSLTDNTGTKNKGMKAYWLPWSRDKGLCFIDMPQTKPEANLFVTPSLTGCYFGIQELGDNQNKVLRLRHWNMFDSLATIHDLDRYGCRNWLIPERKEVLCPNDGVERLHVSYNYKGGHCTVWGEYIEDDWFFFYIEDQDSSKEIHFFYTTKK